MAPVAADAAYDSTRYPRLIFIGYIKQRDVSVNVLTRCGVVGGHREVSAGCARGRDGRRAVGSPLTYDTAVLVRANIKDINAHPTKDYPTGNDQKPPVAVDRFDRLRMGQSSFVRNERQLLV
ncbi:hypothetical protein EVAR_86656_1 [Eumeta japonica]|uniref:Uncharacterized protein n=1 Tax=Eumeta variegata TaxID=151549 RepID=A0A4C1Z8N2_EUMVA|nr:hypothetical protein EVAR_86656_1 [Eumeta japonica]